ncbi:hypothetical protein RBS60_02705 [Sinomonas sp. ASV486]|uniref:hypothetical protein n=1 Tax=Sinomonas sp. ASV486 TaxID=3051170 RepID=UPI0027DC82B4|nr:hypothetical protein [Sinomonas sp. ASV486]MDQ4489107.1 hypothetical protein [Sinomonas sp. ASV486]
MAQHSADVNRGDPPEAELLEFGTLVLRVWREPDAAQGLRVRILTSHGRQEPTSTALATDVEATLAAVRAWLEGQLEGDVPS